MFSLCEVGRAGRMPLGRSRPRVLDILARKFARKLRGGVALMFTTRSRRPGHLQRWDHVHTSDVVIQDTQMLYLPSYIATG